MNEQNNIVTHSLICKKFSSSFLKKFLMRMKSKYDGMKIAVFLFNGFLNSGKT